MEGYGLIELIKEKKNIYPSFKFGLRLVEQCLKAYEINDRRLVMENINHFI